MNHGFGSMRDQELREQLAAKDAEARSLADRLDALVTEHQKAGESWNRQRESLVRTIDDRNQKIRDLCDDLAEAVGMVKICTGHPDTGQPSHFDLIQRAAAEAEYRRRESEFEAHDERWGNAIVGRDGHRYVNGGLACECGESCPSIGDWERHLLASRVAEGRPLCACITDEQAGQLAWAGFSRPVCAVHPEGGEA